MADGPSKVTLDAYEVDIGYKVRYTPLAPGDYYMTIKYNGIHVPGSPYKVKITGKFSSTKHLAIGFTRHIPYQ